MKVLKQLKELGFTGDLDNLEAEITNLGYESHTQDVLRASIFVTGNGYVRFHKDGQIHLVTGLDCTKVLLEAEAINYSEKNIGIDSVDFSTAVISLDSSTVPITPTGEPKAFRDDFYTHLGKRVYNSFAGLENLDQDEFDLSHNIILIVDTDGLMFAGTKEPIWKEHNKSWFFEGDHFPVGLLEREIPSTEKCRRFVVDLSWLDGMYSDDSDKFKYEFEVGTRGEDTSL